MGYTDADVRAALDALWSGDTQRDAARLALAEYGVATHEREVPRVRLAILKLCSGQLDRVKELVGLAKRDYRDVLMWAEYPEEGRSLWTVSARLSTEQRLELAEIRRRDQRQHAEWLARLRRRRPRG